MPPFYILRKLKKFHENYYDKKPTVSFELFQTEVRKCLYLKFVYFCISNVFLKIKLENKIKVIFINRTPQQFG